MMKSETRALDLSYEDHRWLQPKSLGWCSEDGDQTGEGRVRLGAEVRCHPVR